MATLEEKFDDFSIKAIDTLARIDERQKVANYHLEAINGTLEKHSKLLTAHDRALVRIRTITALIGAVAGYATWHVYYFFKW